MAAPMIARDPLAPPPSESSLRRVPERESDDHACLAAWYSGYPYAEHYRKVVLAQCRELVRAKYALKGEKISEARIDDLARNHDNYLDFLAKHLNGRNLWEEEVQRMGGIR